MQMINGNLDGIKAFKISSHEDKRGKFFETYHKERYFEFGINDNFIQDNLSYSKKNVLRGLHFQKINPQSQLVTIIKGSIIDVVVDIRLDSLTFGKSQIFNLNDFDGFRQIYMPPGFAHGFYVISEFAELHYKVTSLYNHENESGIKWNDPTLAIKWPCNNPIVNDRDSNFPFFINSVKR